jgi:gamma-glutamylcyclotransferase (GGCT)/AIG2-like uncharacterized protein YtfP
MDTNQPVPLFVYGTLLADEIVERVIGRQPRTAPAVLSGYACYYVRGATFPGIIREKPGRVEGRIITDLSQMENNRLDSYEDPFYLRTRVKVRVDEQLLQAETYVIPQEKKNLLSSQLWTWDEFERKYLEDFRAALG